MRITPLQLYVHIPFCVHKCHYCDFNSHERSNPDWKNYQSALISELKYWAARPMFAGRKLSSIFFGGGTPSLAPTQLVNDIIQHAKSVFGFEDNIELTLEANPGTIDAEHFSAYRQSGVNRLSMGVQSLNDQELLWLGRIHDSKQALAAFDIARDVGFNNINLDLIYGLPNQSLDAWLDSLRTAITLGPEHLSCYQLTIEPHTKLAASHARSPLNIPDDDLALMMFSDTRARLNNAGYEAYEISNFAVPERKCRHNDGYWLYHDYIGIGAGAAGKWDTPEGGIKRYSNIRSPERYAQASLKNGTSIHTQESLDQNHSAAEALWLGLRREQGVSRHSFQQRFGFDAWEHFSSALKHWHECGKLAVTDRHICLTPKGLPLADAIAASVL
jgi:oxygen-independent coproporphyrinogen-3 oxidase